MTGWLASMFRGCVSMGVGWVLGLVPSVLEVDAEATGSGYVVGLVSEAVDVRRGWKK